MFNFICRIERWKYNIEYGVYVSTEGRIKSKSKKIIRPRTTNTGYLMLYINGKKVLVHRLVMYTWRPTENMKELTVDHLDHNKRNNIVSNLEWVTREENIKRGKEDYYNLLPDDELMVFINKIRGLEKDKSHLLDEKLYVNNVLMSYKDFIDFFWESAVIRGNFKNKKQFTNEVIKHFQLDKKREERKKVKKSFYGVATVRVIGE